MVCSVRSCAKASCPCRSQSKQQRAETQATHPISEDEPSRPQMAFSHVVTGSEVSTGRCAFLPVSSAAMISALLIIYGLGFD